MFGCISFSHISKDERRKLNEKSIKFIFIGYCDDHKAYNLLDSRFHKLIASRDVVFHEITNEDNGVWNTSLNNDDYVKIDTSVEHEEEEFYAYVASHIGRNSTDWYFYSKASKHMTNKGN